MPKRVVNLISKSTYCKHAHPLVEEYNEIQKKRARLNHTIGLKKTGIWALTTAIKQAQKKLKLWHQQLTDLEKKDPPLVTELNATRFRLNNAETYGRRMEREDERKRIIEKCNL